MINIDSDVKDNYQLIKVAGEVDASTSIELDNSLKSAAEIGSDILIDLTELDYISSAGLGVFISYIEELKSKGVTLVIFGLHPKVLEVFEILGLQHIMNISKNLEDAVARINE